MNKKVIDSFYDSKNFKEIHSIIREINILMKPKYKNYNKKI